MKTVILPLSVALLGASLVAQSRDPETRDRQAMQTVTTLLEEGHLTEHRLDDRLSRRAFDSYLEAWDPLKLYFLQGDVDALAAQRDELDDMMRSGDTAFAKRVFQLYLDRVDERIQTIEDLLDDEVDFTIDEWRVIDPDAVEFAADAGEVRERWRKRIKYDLLRLHADGTDDEAARERLRRRYRGFQHRIHRLEADEIVQLFVTSVTTSLDPHSTYMGAHSLENFEIEMRLDYQGIGAMLGEEDDETVVQRILPGGPAEEHGGLKAKDHIVSLGEGEDGPMKDVVGMRFRDVVGMIRGKAGTVIRIGVIPDGGSEMVVHRLVRGRTELVERAATSKVIEREIEGGKKIKVGLVDLPSFYGSQSLGGMAGRRSATGDLDRILGQFNDQSVDIAVLDLRGNGGGYLTEAVDVAGLFIDTGPVVQVRGYAGQVQVLEDENAGATWKGPLVVLVDKFSASASEIVAGAIADYGRGLVVGDDSSHGKGTVQRILPLDRRSSKPWLGALKMTVQKFYRISGDSTQLRGVRTDIQLPSLTNSDEFGEAELPGALPFDRIDPAPHPSYGRVNQDLVRQLVAASKARRQSSEELADLERRAAAFRRARARTRVSLQEKQYLALRAELKAHDDPEQPPEEAHEINADDPYMREVLAIATDYFRLLSGAKLAKDGSGKRPRKSGI